MCIYRAHAHVFLCTHIHIQMYLCTVYMYMYIYAHMYTYINKSCRASSLLTKYRFIIDLKLTKSKAFKLKNYANQLIIGPTTVG